MYSPVTARQSEQQHPPGTVVCASHGFYDHVGILGGVNARGERTVLSFSAQAGGFLEQPLREFSQGGTVRVDGYPGSLAPREVLRRAHGQRGRAYSWATFNCEHFVRWAHGVAIESPQLRQWAFLAAAIGVLSLASR